MKYRYDTDLVKDPFRGASSILKKDRKKNFLATEHYNGPEKPLKG
jgi:hypothetical protein